MPTECNVLENSTMPEKEKGLRRDAYCEMVVDHWVRATRSSARHRMDLRRRLQAGLSGASCRDAQSEHVRTRQQNKKNLRLGKSETEAV
jgi:hypothetical protein